MDLASPTYAGETITIRALAAADHADYLSRAVVHMRGPVHAIEASDWLSSHVDELTERHETKAIGHPNLTDPEFKAGRLGGIVGIQMKVTSIEAKFKLNQNRSATDRSRVADVLAASGDQAAADVAALMRKHGEG